MRHSGRRWSPIAGLCLAGLFAGSARGVEVQTSTLEIAGGRGPIKAYYARPKGDATYPGVVMIHEWWGLTEWVKQNAEAMAAEGYAVLAVDLYGGKATADPAVAHELSRALDHGEAVADLRAGVATLLAQGSVDKTRKFGVVGWCMGGGLARELAQADPVVGPTVICYGSVTTDPEQVAKLKGKPILGIFGATDRGIPVEKVKEFGRLIVAAGGKAEIKVYQAAGHGFMRPGNPSYVAADAADAWAAIKAFFASNLKADR